MKFEVSREKCTGCGACSASCKIGAITMLRDCAGFLYPKVDENNCISCGACLEVCPIDNKIEKCNNSYYGVKADSEKRSSSTSGGVFQLLARKVIKEKGVVFGVKFSEDFKVEYSCTETIEELVPLLSTKYVQANPKCVYSEVEEILKNGKEVLFFGNPCVVHGMDKFLGKKYDNLLLVDHVCFGIPSGGLWERYVEYLEEENNGKLQNFNFRDKRNKDSGHTVSYVINSEEHTERMTDNLFCKLYLRQISLRESCYNCSYCTDERISDLTLGDFWGIEEVNSEFDDGFGVSLVIAHNDKGRRKLGEILEDTSYFETEREKVLQPRLKECSKKSLLSKLFMNDMVRTGVDKCDMNMIKKKFGM